MFKNLLPNFLVIGAAKCGTTSLHSYLRQHPDVFMPEQKEIHFFLGDDQKWGTWNLGLDWYASLFEEANGCSARGEASPGYSVDAQTEVAARKIREVLGSPKLIYFVRDPIDRLTSHYLETYFNSDDLNNIILDDIISNRGRSDHAHYDLYCGLVNTSMYHRQLLKIIPYHDLSNLFIRTQEDFLSDRSTVLQDTLRFLGVGPFPSLPPRNDQNVTISKRKRVWDPVKPLRTSNWYSMVSGRIPRSMKTVYGRLTSRKLLNEGLMSISADNMDHLVSLFDREVEHFYALTGVRVSLQGTFSQ
jgi:hypothetical protein